MTDPGGLNGGAPEHSPPEEIEPAGGRFQAFFEQSLDAALLTTPDGVVEAANPAACRLLGYREEELRGLRPAALMDTSEPRFAAAMEERLRTGRFHGELTMIRRDGTRFPVDLASTLLRDDGGAEWTSVLIRDASARNQAAASAFGFLRETLARQAAERAERRARYVADTVDVLSASLDYRESLQSLAALLVPSLADYCLIDIVEDDGEVNRVAFAHADPRMSELATKLVHFPADVRKERHFIGRVIRTGQPALLRDVGSTLEETALTAEHLEVMRETAPRSIVSAPLHSRGVTIGAITLLSAALSGRVFDEADLALVAELADRAGLAIDNARLFTAEHRARDAAERLQDLTAELGQALTTPEVAATALRYGVSALGADAGVLALLLPAGEELEIVDSVGYAPEACMGPGRRWAADATIPIAEATRTGERVVLGSPQEWADRYLGGYAPGRTSASAAWAAIPVHIEHRVAGALLWTFNRPRHFPAHEIGLMETVARLCSQALERARLLEAERQARAAAEEANRAKMDFLSAMSHELRTPLNAIAGYVDLLDAGVRGEISDVQRGDLKRIKRAQEVLLGLIDDVLHFARLEAGRMQIQSAPVPIAGLLEDMDTMIDPQVRGKGLELRCAPTPAGLTLRGDPERVRQIVLNLVSNAVKFTDPGGSIEIETEGDGERVRLRVRDSGRGIPADKLEEIFAPFVQLDRHRSSESQQGVGLGLAISRELALAMGGELVAHSTVGVGTEFVLTLPRWLD